MEDTIPFSVEIPTVTSTTSSLHPSSENYHSNTDPSHQRISSPNETQLSYPSDVYINPAVVDKYHDAQPNNVISAHTARIVELYESVTSNAIVPSSVPSLIVSNPSGSLNGESRTSSGSWNMEVESPEDLVLFEIPQTQECVDTYRIDDDGLHTYDSLEFQTLREHNLEYSHSSRSL